MSYLERARTSEFDIPPNNLLEFIRCVSRSGAHALAHQHESRTLHNLYTSQTLTPTLVRISGRQVCMAVARSRQSEAARGCADMQTCRDSKDQS